MRNMYSNFLDYKSSIDEITEVKSKFYGTQVYNPDVSIMIPTYKRTDCLRNAIKSVVNQKTNYRFELVIVDNNCETTDEEITNLLATFEPYDISYYRNDKNIGMFGNWNRCVNLAKSRWIVILSDDDELCDNYITMMMDTVKAYPDCGALTCRYNLIDADGIIISDNRMKKFGKNVVKLKIQDFYWCQPTAFYGCMFKKDLALEIGGFQSDYYPCSDAVFLMNICRTSNLYLLNKFLFNYRWAFNESLNKKTQLCFLVFNDKTSELLNKTYQVNKVFDRLYRDGVVDFTIYELLKEKIIQENDVECFKREIGRGLKTSKLRAWFAKSLRKCLRALFWLR